MMGSPHTITVGSEAERYLIEAYGLVKTAAIARRLGCSTATVHSAAYRRGLTQRQQLWTVPEQRIVEQYAHESVASITKRIRAAGYQRAAMSVKNKRAKVRAKLAGGSGSNKTPRYWHEYTSERVHELEAELARERATVAALRQRLAEWEVVLGERLVLSQSQKAEEARRTAAACS